MDENNQLQQEPVIEDILKTSQLPKEQSFPLKTLLYIIVGFFLLFALMLPIGYIGYKQQLNNMAEEAKRTIPTPRPRMQTSPTPDSFLLDILSPYENMHFTDDSIAVGGKTIPGTSLVIYTERDEVATDAASSGFFSAQIPLIAGNNKITFTAFTSDGREKTVTIGVVKDVP